MYQKDVNQGIQLPLHTSTERIGKSYLKSKAGRLWGKLTGSPTLQEKPTALINLRSRLCPNRWIRILLSLSLSWKAVIRVILTEKMLFKIELAWCPENRKHLQGGGPELNLLQCQGKRQLWEAVVKRGKEGQADGHKRLPLVNDIHKKWWLLGSGRGLINWRWAWSVMELGVWWFWASGALICCFLM